jgi:hypothetical protein
MADKTKSIKPGAKTGTRPSGNSKGQQGAGLAPSQVKGMSTIQAGAIFAEGKGPKANHK